MKCIDIKEFENKNNVEVLLELGESEGIVLLTYHKPTHVLISAEEYDKLRGLK